MTDREPYHEANAISSGGIKRAHFKSLYDYKFGVRRDDTTAAMRIGNHAHRGLLQPDYAESQLVIYDGAARRGKKWEAFVEANPHVSREEIVNRKEHEQILGCIEGVKRKPDALALVTGGTAEMEIFWTDEITGLRCKAKPDMFRQPVLVDLKTVSSRHFNRDRLPTHATSAGWPIQLAWYVMGLRAHGYTVTEANIVVVESRPPHDCVVWQVASHLMRSGVQICRKTLDAIAACEKSGDWPGLDRGGPLVLGDPWEFAAVGSSSKAQTNKPEE
jgi:exodeoxyribonuclease VIII